ncbi:MAG: xanthine dehydrogenase family protein molybdopterin-binding subunit, partial [Marinicaulis sp.]|nr:molybdopterin-dependent oxidoreductase [Marinicaulis sp.]NNL88352.1 xanthine dehydrogenase family protein molybdopterin-binding subunit [Marinicaulis sp.]
MRSAGAAARIVLTKAAAKSLGVSASELTTENGMVIAADGTSIAYTELAGEAANIKPPSNPPLREKSKWRYLGKSLDRLDMVEKCTGTAEYAIDVRLPDMAYATVRVNCHLGAGVKSYDASKAKARADVKKVVPVKNGLAVVSTNTWNAFQAVQDLEIEWEPAPYPVNDADIVASHRAAFDDKPDSQKRKDGDVEAVLAEGDIIETEYLVPYLAHATMEPMNAVAHLRDGKLDLWVGTQSPTRCLDVAKDLTGLDEDDIDIHTMYLGGGFGRRGEIDFVAQAIEVAKAMEGTPIKLVWSREEDMCHDMYRPLTLARFRGAIRDGKPAAFDMHVAASAAAIDAFERQGMNLNMADPTITQNAWDNPYKIDNYRVTGYRAKKALPVGFWRSVGASQNAFFQECATDELANAANADPLQFRLDMLDHEPSRKVLEAVAEMSGWGGALPEGRARGIAYYLSFGVPVAEVIEIVDTGAGLKVDKAFVAADVGLALDPRNIEAQLQSGVIYGLTAAIQGAITIEDGVVKQKNFNEYDAMRMYQAPSIDVRILENGPHITGVGEPGLPPAAPALANAIFALSGKRIRELPLNNSIAFI